MEESGRSDLEQFSPSTPKAATQKPNDPSPEAGKVQGVRLLASRVGTCFMQVVHYKYSNIGGALNLQSDATSKATLHFNGRQVAAIRHKYILLKCENLHSFQHLLNSASPKAATPAQSRQKKHARAKAKPNAAWRSAIDLATKVYSAL